MGFGKDILMNKNDTWNFVLNLNPFVSNALISFHVSFKLLLNPMSCRLSNK